MHPLATTNVYICRGKREEREKKRKLSWERKKNLGIGEVFFEKSFRRNLSKNFHAKFRAPVQRELEGDLVHEGGEIPAHVLPGHTLVSTPVQRG